MTKSNKGLTDKSNFNNILTILKVYLIALVVFTIFRAVLLYTQIDKMGTDTGLITVFQSFFMGFRFDTVIICYVLLLPFLLLTVQQFIGRSSKVYTQIIFWLVFILFTLSFVVSGADIPYFEQFFSRFSITAFEWMDSPVFVFKMILEEPRLWLFALPVIGIIYLFYRILKRVLVKNNTITKPQQPVVAIVASVLFLGVFFMGMRGRLDEKSPIRVGTAYFSEDPLLNQLGLNPNFTLLKSYLESKKESNRPVQLMDSDKALKNTYEFLEFTPSSEEFPLKRIVNELEDSTHTYNVIVIMMESMTAAKMGRHGNSHNMTPFLDSLSREGAYFENAYSAGIHTFNGIYSTLFAYPAFFRKHPMKSVEIPYLHGMGTAFKKNDYSTLYFTTHDGQFDNVEGFLRANDYDRITTKADYPPEKVKTTLGVPDDYMFEFSMPILDEMHSKNKPFFAAYMTASDHKPYYIPPYFKPRNDAVDKQIVEYADYSLERLIVMASKKDWFENTLFVFVADHGSAMGSTYDITLAYNHVPMLFYAPKLIPEGKSYTEMAGQIDIFPSVMGLLNLPYEDHSLGVNLFKKERPYIYFNVDDKYGVVDQEWLLIVRKDQSTLHRYPEKDKKDYAAEYPEKVAEMKKYAESQMQVYQDEVLLKRNH